MIRIYFLSLVVFVFSNCQSDNLEKDLHIKNSVKAINITSLDKVIGETLVSYD